MVSIPNNSLPAFAGAPFVVDYVRKKDEMQSAKQEIEGWNEDVIFLSGVAWAIPIARVFSDLGAKTRAIGIAHATLDVGVHADIGKPSF